MVVEAVEKLIAAPIPRIEIPGLDTVEWAEGDARRGRGGRGRGRPVAKAPARPAKARDEEPAREPAAEAVREPAREPTRERTPRPPRSEQRGENRAEHRPAPRREEPAARVEEPRRREPRTVYATDNNGPSVRGFGTDVPPFWKSRTRSRKTTWSRRPRTTMTRVWRLEYRDKT